MDFKKKLYSSYVTSHLVHRKGQQNAATLARFCKIFDQHFGSLLPADRALSLIDLGCGAGNLVFWLKQRGYANVRGIDASQEQVEIAHQSGIGEVILGDVFSALTGRAEYDLIFARDLIEHLDRETIYTLLDLCRKSLRPGGAIILQVPNAESPFFGRIRYGDFTHEIAFTRSSVAQILTSLGYSGITIRPWRPPVTNIVSLIRHILWRLLEPIIIFPMFIETGGRGRIVTVNLIIKASVP